MLALVTLPFANPTISFLGNPQSQITDIQCDSNYVQATLKEVMRTDGEVRYEVTTKLRDDVPVQRVA